MFNFKSESQYFDAFDEKDEITFEMIQHDDHSIFKSSVSDVKSL